MKLLVNNMAHSQINGPGNRLVIWVQGCPFRCSGCFNPETHPMEGGKPFSVSALVTLINRDKEICGVTFSGGEPLLYAEAIGRVLERMRKGLTRIVFTGYTVDEMRKDPAKWRVLQLADLVISGRYDAKAVHPYVGKKFLRTTERVPLDYFKPYRRVEYTVCGDSVTKTGIF